MSLDELLHSDRIGDIFILARYTYRIGEPILDDKSYEKLLNMVKKHRPDYLIPYLERTYDDDPVPIRLLEEVGIGVKKTEVKLDREGLYQYLDEEKSYSIDSVTNYDAAYDFFQIYRNLGKDLMVSLKMDGDNTKTLYLAGKLALSLSRGRSGYGFDFTDTIRYCMPGSIEGLPEETKVFAECFVNREYLPVLRKKYNPDKYKTAKSAAISLLRVPHKAEDYIHLNAVVFNIEGIADTLEETFKLGKKFGFNMVEHKLIKSLDIPVSRNEFNKWLKENVLDYMYNRASGLPTDGVVVEVNDLNYEGEVKGHYTTRQLALKFEQWSFKYYKGIVKNIIWEQRRVFASCRLEIVPMQTHDDCTATFINAFNPSILVREGIHKGSEVYFERNSDAVNILLYGERLTRILEQG